jgi:hypothetical protein
MRNVRCLSSSRYRSHTTPTPAERSIDGQCLADCRTLRRGSKSSRGPGSQEISSYNNFREHMEYADGGTRTRTTLSGQRILSPLRLPFRHIGFLVTTLFRATCILNPPSGIVLGMSHKSLEVVRNNRPQSPSRTDILGLQPEQDTFILTLPGSCYASPTKSTL